MTDYGVVHYLPSSFVMETYRITSSYPPAQAIIKTLLIDEFVSYCIFKPNYVNYVFVLSEKLCKKSCSTMFLYTKLQQGLALKRFGKCFADLDFSKKIFAD